MDGKSIIVKAPAKLNLTLDVVGRRDDGYHLLDMLITTVDIYDIVEINVTGGGIAVSDSKGILPAGTDNLAGRAAAMYFECAGIAAGAEIKITKNIPIAAGLGGGSSDAAAVLKGLNSIFGALSREQLFEVALMLGADVPMCLLGGTMRAGGIGEKLTPLPLLKDCIFVVTKNGTKGSTAAMYGKLSVSDFGERYTEKAVKAAAGGDIPALVQSVGNAFSAVIDDRIVTEDMEIISSAGALAVSVSGSGPAVFGIFENEESAQRCADKLKKNGKTGIICRPVA